MASTLHCAVFIWLPSPYWGSIFGYVTVSTETELSPKWEGKETGDTGMAQLIVTAVLHSNSDLIKIHIVNEKKAYLGVWERHFYFEHNLHYIKLSVFTLWKCWHKLRVTHKASLFFKYRSIEVFKYRMHKKAYKRWKCTSERKKNISNAFY